MESSTMLFFGKLFRLAILLSPTIASLMFGLWAIVAQVAQISVWYSSGNWQSIPASAFFYYEKLDYPRMVEDILPNQFGDSTFAQWLQFPSSALGPHKLVTKALEVLSFPAFLMFLSIFLFVLTLTFIYLDKRDEYN